MNWDIMGNYFVDWANKPIKMETIFLYKKSEQIIISTNNSVNQIKTQQSDFSDFKINGLKMSLLHTETKICLCKCNTL